MGNFFERFKWYRKRKGGTWIKVERWVDLYQVNGDIRNIYRDNPKLETVWIHNRSPNSSYVRQSYRKDGWVKWKYPVIVEKEIKREKYKRQ